QLPALRSSPPRRSSDLQGSLQHTGQTRVATVPTALQRAGDFSELGSRIFDPLTGAAFPGNRIPVSRFNNISQQVASFYPAPTGQDRKSTRLNSSHEWIS